MKTKAEIIEILKEFSQMHVKTDDPEEYFVMSSSNGDNTFDKLTDTLLQDEQKQAEERYDKAMLMISSIDGHPGFAMLEIKEALKIASGFNPPKTER